MFIDSEGDIGEVGSMFPPPRITEGYSAFWLRNIDMRSLKLILAEDSEERHQVDSTPKNAIFLHCAFRMSYGKVARLQVVFIL